MRVLLIITVALISSIVRTAPLAHTSIDHIRHWSFYRNQRLGFSIEYPTLWQADDHEGEYNPIVIIYPRHPKPHEFYITISIENRTLSEIRKSYGEFTAKSPSSRFKEREIIFANKTSYQFRRSDNP